MVWQKAGRSTEARQAYETALALDPGQAIAANNLARLYAADTSMTETAIGLARVAVTRMPDEPEAHDTLGWAYYKGGQLRLAARELERAVALDPQEETYRSRLAEVRGAIVEEERRARRD
jgi:Flp pilus assembly protein TadD